MDRVARYAKVTAKEGNGERLAELLLGAAADLEDDPGCELYLIHRQADSAEVIWVTELWRSQADLDASRERARGSATATEAMELVDAWEMIELDLLGGKR